MPTIHRASGLESDELDEIISDMGDLWITFKSGSRSCGYWVKIEERSTRYAAAFFSLATYGNAKCAKEAATEYRDTFIRDHQMLPSQIVSNIPSKLFKKTCNLSGISGLRLSFTQSSNDETKYYARWIAQTASGQVSFGVSKFGFDEAYRIALEERLSYLMQSDDIDNYELIPREIVETYLAEKLGKKWKSRLVNYDQWWDSKPEDQEAVNPDNAKMESSVEERKSIHSSCA